VITHSRLVKAFVDSEAKLSHLLDNERSM